MSYVRKNIFGFATIAATVTLSAAIFATGCGDSGDSTAVNPLNPDKIANAITVNFKDEATLKANNVESVSWLITDGDADGDGKQLAVRKTAQKIHYTGTTTKANAALAEEATTSNDTTADNTSTSATQNDKCYVVLGVPSTIFQKMNKVTLTYIYYDKSGKIVGFGSDINEVTWNNDKSGNRYSGTVTDGNFFPEKNAQYSLTASPEFIKKYDEELAKKDPNATQADAFTTLAYNVTDGTTTANIIGLVDIDNYKDIKDYIQPEEVKVGEYPTPGRYKGVAYTTAYGAEVEVKLDRASVSGDTHSTRVYVTDRTPSKLDVNTIYQKTVLVPENVKEQGQTKTADYALGQTKATSSESKRISYGVRQLPLEVYVSDWGEGKSAKPNAYPKVDTSKVTFAVKDGTQKAFKAEDVAVENGVVKFKQSKLDAPVAFTVEAAYGQATGKLEGAKAVPATVEVGFGQEAKATDGTTSIAKDFTTKVEGDSNKDVTASLKMYARFVTGGVGGFTSYLFEIPESAGFTYPSTAALFDADSKIYNAQDATVTIATADQQKANDYSVTIKKDNQKNNLKVRFVEKDTTPYTELEQIKAFGAFTKLDIQNLLDLVIAPETQVDPTPSPTPGGNPDPDAGDQP